MERVGITEAAFNLLTEFLSRGLVYLLLIAGVWVLISSGEIQTFRDKVRRVFGILLLGIGLGLLGINLVSLRLGQ